MTRDRLKNTLLTSSRRHFDEFASVAGKFEDRGILHSEMLAVCSLIESQKINVIIESGRWRGQSTEILAKYFHAKPVQIESIELFHDNNALYVEAKLARHSNVQLHYGDANRLVPFLAKKHPGKKIAVLFDGPKGKSAINLFRLSFLQAPNIVLGFFHDMRLPTSEMPNIGRKEMEEIFPQAFFTDDTDYVKEFQTLDEQCTTALWKPYSIDGNPIGSYGPTLAIIVPSQKDRNSAWRGMAGLWMTTQLALLKSSIVRLSHSLRGLKA